jgi:hypothetical protein
VIALMRRLAAIGAAGLLCLLPLVTACSGRGKDNATSGNGSNTPAVSTKTTDAEVRYGRSPTRNSQVTYQDDVIVMEHGAEAIRAQSANGMTWTLDANAPDAPAIQPNKILFATGRVVGRVLAVEQTGDGLAVTLGPITLTDVIRDAQITYEGALDPAAMIAYLAPDYPGTFTDQNAPERAGALHRHDEFSTEVVRFLPTGEAVPLRTVDWHGRRSPAASWRDKGLVRFQMLPALFLAPASGGPDSAGAIPGDLLINDSHFSPDARNGLGVKQKYAKNGMQFVAYAKVVLNNPAFKFSLDIAKGHLNTAAIEVSGMGGVEVSFDGGTNDEFQNVNHAFELPLDISLPIGGIGIPFSATFHQSVLINTLFTAKQGVVNASGAYRIGGAIKAGIINGQPAAGAPVFMSITNNLANSVSGASLGVNGLVLGYGGKLIVGLGAWGLVVGPYLSVNTSIGITRGSDTQVPIVGYTCRTADLNIWLDYGVGYAIPNTVVKALNTFLALFHAESINAAHGTSLGTSSIYHSNEGVPPSCASKPAA